MHCSIHFFSIHFTDQLLLSYGSPVCPWSVAWKPQEQMCSWEPLWVPSLVVPSWPVPGTAPGDRLSLCVRHTWMLGSEQSPACLVLLPLPARGHNQDLSGVQLGAVTYCLSWILDCFPSEKDHRNKKCPLFLTILCLKVEAVLSYITYLYHTISLWSHWKNLHLVCSGFSFLPCWIDRLSWYPRNWCKFLWFCTAPSGTMGYSVNISPTTLLPWHEAEGESLIFVSK